MSQHVQGVPQPLLVLVTGKPGSGKSTLAIELGQAQNLGLAVTETRFAKLNERANALIQALIDRIPGHD